MGLIVLEALAALAALLFIVWWTMFSGRRGGEVPPDMLADETRAASLKKGQGADEEDGVRDARGGSKKLNG